MIFRLRKDIVLDEEGNRHPTYGMDVYGCIHSVPDIFTDKEKMQLLIDRCNLFQPEMEHVQDVIVDAIQ